MGEMKVLREWLPITCDKEIIKEDKAKFGKIMLKGIIQRANTLNQNGRVYPKSILQREIENYQKLIRENRALGECDHPDSSVIELKNASHIVREAYMQGDDVYGTIEILDTPSGKIIQSLIESGITLGISSRGVGSTSTNGNTQVVQDDFQLICFDMVSEPSTPGAYVSPARAKTPINMDPQINVYLNESKNSKIDNLIDSILRD